METKLTIKEKIVNWLKKAGWITLLLVLLSLTGYGLWRNYTVSEGSRTGVLFKISKKGKVFKTYEGQLFLAGAAMMNKNSVWDFSVLNTKVYEKIQSFEGKNIRLHYKEKVDAFPWQGDTDYIVFEVEEIIE